MFVYFFKFHFNKFVNLFIRHLKYCKKYSTSLWPCLILSYPNILHKNWHISSPILSSIPVILSFWQTYYIPLLVVTWTLTYLTTKLTLFVYKFPFVHHIILILFAYWVYKVTIMYFHCHGFIHNVRHFTTNGSTIIKMTSTRMSSSIRIWGLLECFLWKRCWKSSLTVSK